MHCEKETGHEENEANGDSRVYCKTTLGCLNIENYLNLFIIPNIFDGKKILLT